MLCELQVRKVSQKHLRPSVGLDQGTHVKRRDAPSDRPLAVTVQDTIDDPDGDPFGQVERDASGQRHRPAAPSRQHVRDANSHAMRMEEHDLFSFMCREAERADQECLAFEDLLHRHALGLGPDFIHIQKERTKLRQLYAACFLCPVFPRKDPQFERLRRPTGRDRIVLHVDTGDSVEESRKFDVIGQSLLSERLQFSRSRRQVHALVNAGFRCHRRPAVALRQSFRFLEKTIYQPFGESNPLGLRVDLRTVFRKGAAQLFISHFETRARENRHHRLVNPGDLLVAENLRLQIRNH